MKITFKPEDFQGFDNAEAIAKRATEVYRRGLATYAKTWREKNKPKLQSYYQRNREKLLEKQKVYNKTRYAKLKADPVAFAKAREQKRLWYKNNPDRVAAINLRKKIKECLS